LTSSAQAPYRSLPCKHESSLISLRLLSEPQPLRWVVARFPAPSSSWLLFERVESLLHLVLKNYAGFRVYFEIVLLPFTRTAVAILMFPQYLFIDRSFDRPSVACSQILESYIVQFSRCSF
jgi:hypothetical protein